MVSKNRLGKDELYNPKKDERSSSVDLAKGTLVLLVIAGHVIVSDYYGKEIRDIIYSFHMPLFIGLSGYLLNCESLFRNSYVNIFEKYKYRLIVPWLIALLFYFIFHEIQRANSKILTNIFMELLFPFYHLWFIPAFLFWMLIVRLIGGYANLDHYITSVSIGSCSVLFALKENELFYNNYVENNLALKFFFKTLRPYYFAFFIFGINFRKMIKYFKSMDIGVIIIMTIFSWWLFFQVDGYMVSTITYYIFNLLLLSLLLLGLERDKFPRIVPLEWMGINSMGIYLWHMFPILIIKYFLNYSHIFNYYAAVIIAISVFFFAYSMLNRTKFFRQLLFGLS
jgi:acyltransferase